MLRAIKLTGYFASLIIVGGAIGSGYAFWKLFVAPMPSSEVTNYVQASSTPIGTHTRTLNKSLLQTQTPSSGRAAKNTSPKPPSSSSTSVHKDLSGIPTLSIDSIQHLHLKSDQSHGNVDIDYHSDANGNIHLDGHIGNTHVHLTGNNATQEMTKLLSSSGVSDSIQKVLADPTARIPMPPFQIIDIQEANGTHISFQPNGTFQFQVQKRLRR